MSDTRPTFRRRRYIINLRLQLAVTLQLLAVLGGVALLYASAIYFIPGGDALQQLNAEETRSLLLRANVVYFTLATAILLTVAFLVTHRIAGPVFVIERAVRAWLTGDYSERLKLRRRDYLKSLAEAVEELREHHLRDEETRQRLLGELSSCLDEQDPKAARELLAQLGWKAPETAEQESPATEPAV